MRKRRVVIGLWIAGFVILCGVGLALKSFISAPEAAKKVPLPRWKLPDVFGAAILLVEKPDAVTVRYIDEAARLYEPTLSAYGLMEPQESKAVSVSCVIASSLSKETLRAAKDLTERGIMALRLDVSKMKMSEFKRILTDFPFSACQLWMISTSEWLLVGANHPRKLKLESVLEVFTREVLFEAFEANACGTLPDVLTAYVGTKEDILPAFEGAKDEIVAAPFFVTREVPQLDWISRDEADEEIDSSIRATYTANQQTRRLVLQAELAGQSGKVDEAIDQWAQAFQQNPHDPFLIERLYQLAVNAKAFSQVGNMRGAAKCYETMISINPRDVSVLMAYADALRASGQAKLAEQVSQRAFQLNYRQQIQFHKSSEGKDSE